MLSRSLGHRAQNACSVAKKRGSLTGAPLIDTDRLAFSCRVDPVDAAPTGGRFRGRRSAADRSGWSAKAPPGSAGASASQSACGSACWSAWWSASASACRSASPSAYWSGCWSAYSSASPSLPTPSGNRTLVSAGMKSLTNGFISSSLDFVFEPLTGMVMYSLYQAGCDERATRLSTDGPTQRPSRLQACVLRSARPLAMRSPMFREVETLLINFK